MQIQNVHAGNGVVMAMDKRITAKDVVNSLIEADDTGAFPHGTQGGAGDRPWDPGTRFDDLPDADEPAEDEDYRDALADIEDGDCAIIQDNGFNCTCSFAGEDLTRAAREIVLKRGGGLEAIGVDDCLAAIKAQAEKEGYFPAVYSINDHGNISILDPKTGKAIKSWV